ncbi:MAG: hypothetical protein V4469_02625 [Patescibacteria group bacterium]
MVPTKILASGKFSPQDLIVSVSESNRKIDSSIESQIDAVWEAKKKDADEKGQICYNGTSYRLNSLEAKENKIFLDFGTLEFKTRVSLLQIPEYFNLPPEYYKKGCTVDSTIKTADRRYLMVELSGKSLNHNVTDVLGGLIEKPLELSTGNDIFNALYIELEEEGSIHKSDVKEIYLKSIYLACQTDIHFYFEVELNLDIEELREKFDKENEDQDIESIKDFSREEYLDHLKNHKSKNKQLIAELLEI